MSAPNQPAEFHAVRSNRLRAGLTVLFVFIVFATSAYVLATTSLMADSVRIHIDGVSRAGAGRLEVIFSPAKEAQEWKVAQRLKKSNYWYFDNNWFEEVFVMVPEDVLKEVRGLTITIGDAIHRFSGDEVRGWHELTKKPSERGGYEIWLVVPLPTRPSSIPGIGDRLLNWPGDWAYGRRVVHESLFPILIVLLIAYWSGQRTIPNGIEPPSSQESASLVEQGQDRPSRPQEKLFDRLGLVALAALLVFLEVREPFYFTKCDSLGESLPMMLVGCRSVWRGEFPNYNPYVLLGSPLANLGLYSLTYPPLYVAYALARHVVDNEYATVEVFVWMHLVAGFFVTRRLGRSLGMSALPANLVALACVFSGTSLIMGRSWFNFIPIVFWLPVLFLGLLRWSRGAVSWGWVLGMGVALGLPVHIGFPQVAFYLDGFFCLGALYLLCTQSMPRRRALMIVPALLIGASLALPLAYQQRLLATDAKRIEAPNAGIYIGLPAMFLPYPLVEAQIPAGWGNENIEYMGHFYFFGGLFAFLFFYHVIGLVLRRLDARPWSHELWTFCGLIAFWLALGQGMGLWALLSNVPVIERINRHPMRVMPFFVFFASMVGGLVLEKWLRRSSSRREIWVGAFAALLMAYHVFNCQTTFHLEAFGPFPEPPAELLAKMRAEGGRVGSWGHYSTNLACGTQLPGNLPAVYELPMMLGTCPLLEANKSSSRLILYLADHAHETLRAYGVRWNLRQSEGQWTPVGTLRSYSWRLEVVSNLDGEEFLDRFPVTHYPEGIDMYDAAPVDPLAFPIERPAEGPGGTKSVGRKPLDIHLHGWGIEVDVKPATGPTWIVVNFMYYREMQAWVDGQAVPCQPDYWGRINVPIPAGARTLTIRYTPPWGEGLLLGLAVGIIGLVLAAVLLSGRSETAGAIGLNVECRTRNVE